MKLRINKYILLFSVVLALFLFPLSANPQMDRRTLHFCGDSQFAPYSFLSEENDAEGYSVDLTKVLSATIDRDISIHLMSLDKCISEIKNGKIDGLIGIPKLKALDRYLDYSIQTAKIEYAIFVESRNTYVNSIKSLAGTVVGVQKLSPIIEDLMSYENW